MLRAPPALAEQVAEGLGGLPVDHGHHLVPRRVAVLVGHDPPLVDLQVGRRVPAVDRDVAPAGEGDAVVDHHHLLVMAGPEWDMVIQPELDRRVREPLAGLVREEFLAGGDRQGRLPNQQPHVELRPGSRERDQHVAHLVGIIRAVITVREQARAWIESPTEDQDRAAGLLHGLVDGREIGLGVDQERDALGAGRAPAGLAGGQQHRPHPLEAQATKSPRRRWVPNRTSARKSAPAGARRAGRWSACQVG